jgi:hypothetical protein
MTDTRMKLAVALLLASTSAVADPKPEVTAKVVEMPKSIIRCGVIAFQAVVHYRVISVDKGSYASKDVFAIELCPENLKVGDKRRLRLLNPVTTGNVHDEFKTTPGTRWAIEHR